MRIKFMLLYRALILNKKNVLEFSPKFVIKDSTHVIELVKELEELFQNLRVLSDKGFVNNTAVDLPILSDMVHYYRMTRIADLAALLEDKKNFKKAALPVKSAGKSVFVGSIVLNTICFNFVLLVMYRIVIQLEKWFVENPYSKSQLIDNWSDLRTVRRNILIMLHPLIKNKISAKGIQITLNTVVGYDSEYDLESSLKKTNKLLSIQLAATSYMNVKVPTFGKSFTVKELKIKGRQAVGEKTYVDIFKISIDTMIKNIRDSLYKENDLMMSKLDVHLEKLVKDGEIRGKIYLSEENSRVYSFKKSDVSTLIKILDIYSFEDLVRDSELLTETNNRRDLTEILAILNEICGNERNLSEKMMACVDKSIARSTSRINLKYNNSKNNISISVIKNLYLCMHETAADLAMLSDFESIKEFFDAIGRSFVTIGKPLKIMNSSGCLIGNSRIYIRDTILLAPQGAKSLADVGKIYGPDYHKIDIGDYRKGKMSVLLEENRPEFERYAIRDSVITLKHATMMEEFYFGLGKTSVPLTLSGISKAYVIKEWEAMKYEGYQINSDIMIGNLTSKLTPRDARGIGLSKYIVQYLSGYRGGRNETMMYGFSELQLDQGYYDYDMTSAYTTVMSILGHPDYDKAVRLTELDVRRMEQDPRSFLFSYTVLEVEFKFDKNTKYPCIPARVDEDVDIYPLEGNGVITGPEYLVAVSMGCKITIKDGVRIPFRGYKSSVEKDSYDHKSIIADIKPLIGVELGEDLENLKNMEESVKIEVNERIELRIEEMENKALFDDILEEDERGELVLSYKTPFAKIMRDLQCKRRMHEKKTFYNYMYKEIGNTVYGLVSMGVSGKTRYDAKSKSHIRVAGGVLSNPILSGYITGFCRAFVGECMNNIQILNGSVVSVTTDGFVTGIKCLEDKILSLDISKRYCLSIYKILRKLLTIGDKKEYDDSALETKHEEKIGLLSWKTRGQFGLSEKGISAATGFQSRHYSKEFLKESFCELMSNNKEKGFEYVQSGLRGAPDLLKYGGHVMMKYKDQRYTIEYDNKRCVVEENKGGFFDTQPWNNVDEYSKIRILKKTISVPIYRGYSVQPSKGYKSYIETGVRGFIKVWLNDPATYGIPIDFFENYQSLIDFIYGHEPTKEVKLSRSSISHLKRRSTLKRSVPRTEENELFINYVKSKIDTFDSDLFFRELSSEKIKALKKENKKKASVNENEVKELELVPVSVRIGN